MRRRAFCVLAAAALAACEDDPPAPPVTQPRFDFLLPIALRVGTTDIAVTAPPSPLAARSPIDPVAALRRIAEDRLHAAGGDGRAVYTVTEASLSRAEGGGVAGQFGVRLDIFDAAGRPVGSAEAHTARTRADADDLDAALTDVTRQLLDAMNVEFEYQVRRTLAPYVIAIGSDAGPVVPAPVTRVPLSQ